MIQPPLISLDVDIQITPTPTDPETREHLMRAPGFGKVFSDHMVIIPYKEGEGWGKGILKPFGPITLHPAAAVLHYGQSIFEGFKAYRQKDGGIKSFRPLCNAQRFNESAQRLSMPELPVDIFVAAADLLGRTDHAWVPSHIDPERLHDESYYYRPTMIGLGESLGLKQTAELAFLLIGGPTGAYFQGGVQPVTIWIEEDYVRACPGGTGRAKCGGNYAASFLPGQLAKKRGCDQALYLDAIHRQYLEELGGMNVFLVLDDGSPVIITPEKTGTLLEGITRDSLITVAREQGYTVEERRISIDEVEAAYKRGTLKEAFACGTAAVVSPIGTLVSRRGTWVLNEHRVGDVSRSLRNALLDIQYGITPDTRDWMHTIL